MRKFGIIGYPLDHSFSPQYFKDKIRVEGIPDTDYVPFPIESIDEFPQLISGPDIEGLNVTIPYKESVIPFLDTLDVSATKIGAVNCIKLVRFGETVISAGYNTDWKGFLHTLKPHLKIHHRRALVFGSGGSSKAVRFALDELNIKYLIVSRTEGDITYSQINEDIMDEYGILINTTPVGMFPNQEEVLPIPLDKITKDHICYDLIYNPEQTEFLKAAERVGAKAINGLSMLHLQAEESWKVWN